MVQQDTKDDLQTRTNNDLIQDFNNLATPLEIKCQYDEIRRAYLQNLELCWELNDLRGAALCLSNLGNLASEQGGYSDAQMYYQKAQEIIQTIQQTRGNQEGEEWKLNDLNP